MLFLLFISGKKIDNFSLSTTHTLVSLFLKTHVSTLISKNNSSQYSALNFNFEVIATQSK